MADGGFDPCECIWNHENAMQRLMNLVGSGARHLIAKSYRKMAVIGNVELQYFVVTSGLQLNLFPSG